jgi:hypothetical protein
MREFTMLAHHLVPYADHLDRSEAGVQAEIRLTAPARRKYLFRNNRGALKDMQGRLVRYGLANDSKPLGDQFKSGDLIGWEQIVITAEMVGSTIARFLSVECKRRDWRPSNNAEEIAQANWAALVNIQGGRAIITNSATVL